MMNKTSITTERWVQDVQYGNLGASLFIITYIGLYGLGIICFFGHQLKETQQQRCDLPEYFLKSLWDVPSKNKLYEELADVERLKHIFRGYFADHESYLMMKHDELETIVEERAYSCAIKYREKLRRLHLSHTDYLDPVRHVHEENCDIDESSSKLQRITMTNADTGYTKQEDDIYNILSVTVV